MKSIVIYYSGKGSNKFLAEKAAEALDCNLVKLVPRIPGLVLLATGTKICFGNKPLKNDFSSYDSVVLCGPIYMGQFAAPCNDFIRKYGNRIKKLNIITCCGSSDKAKDDRFGYAKVLDKIKASMGEKLGAWEAFPIELVVPEEKKSDDQAMMKTRLSDSNFNGEIRTRLEKFITKI